MKLHILGCGTSGGVPQMDKAPGGDWGNCDPKNPKNRRKRTSALIEHKGQKILIDTGPDLREQLLPIGCEGLNTVIYTHAHADHLHGIDDLRFINQAIGGPLTVYADSLTREQITNRFPYVLKPLTPGEYIYKPWLEIKPLDQLSEISGIKIEYFEQPHGRIPSNSLRFDVKGEGSIAYSTDLIDIPTNGFNILENIDIWCVEALRYEPHPTHTHLKKTLGWIERTKAKKAYLIHMDNSMDYDTLCTELPKHIRPAYDGQTLTLEPKK